MFDSLVRFLQKISQIELMGTIPVDVLAKEVGVEVPEILKNGNIRAATVEDKPGGNRFTVSQMKSKFDWLSPLFAKSKCYLICWGEGESMHCLHICVTCLDGWPGPGCYIHGSYD